MTDVAPSLAELVPGQLADVPRETSGTPFLHARVGEGFTLGLASGALPRIDVTR